MKRSLFILLLASVLISCNDKKEQLTANVITYPMTDGTQWTYDHQILYKKFESETSTIPMSVDTFNHVEKVWIDKDTILRDKTVKMFKAQEVGYNYTAVLFNFIDNEGLKTMAYLRPIFDVFANQPVHLKSAAMAEGLFNDDIRYEVTPTLNIPMPLKSDSKWTFRGPTQFNPSHINKEVSGTETLKLIGQEFNCYKVIWIHSEESAFTNVHITDWISDKGLIKRTISFDRLGFNDENGSTYDYSEIIHSYTLKALDIK